MSFKYPPANTSVQKGNGFYRIKAQAVDLLGSPLSAVGPGDLIPIDVGFNSIAVGPESDYENYELHYLDPTAPGGVQIFPFSKDAPLLGFVTADNSQPYLNSDGEKAQAFVRIADRGTLNGFQTQGSEQRVAEALVDLLIYTGAAPTHLNTRRSPNRRSGNVALVDNNNPNIFYIPGYGRRIFTMECNQMFVVGAAVTAQVEGIRLYNPLTSKLGGIPDLTALSGKTVVQIITTELLPAAAVVGTFGIGSLSFSHNAELAGGQGYFDFYRVTLRSDTAALPSDFSRGRGFHLTMEVRD